MRAGMVAVPVARFNETPLPTRPRGHRRQRPRDTPGPPGSAAAEGPTLPRPPVPRHESAQMAGDVGALRRSEKCKQRHPANDGHPDATAVARQGCQRAQRPEHGRRGANGHEVVAVRAAAAKVPAAPESSSTALAIPGPMERASSARRSPPSTAFPATWGASACRVSAVTDRHHSPRRIAAASRSPARTTGSAWTRDPSGDTSPGARGRTPRRRRPLP
jgi:hypothetical protein